MHFFAHSSLLPVWWCKKFLLVFVLAMQYKMYRRFGHTHFSEYSRLGCLCFKGREGDEIYNVTNAELSFDRLLKSVSDLRGTCSLSRRSEERLIYFLWKDWSSWRKIWLLPWERFRSRFEVRLWRTWTLVAEIVHDERGSICACCPYPALIFITLWLIDPPPVPDSVQDEILLAWWHI